MKENYKFVLTSLNFFLKIKSHVLNIKQKASFISSVHRVGAGGGGDMYSQEDVGPNVLLA